MVVGIAEAVEVEDDSSPRIHSWVRSCAVDDLQPTNTFVGKNQPCSLRSKKALFDCSKRALIFCITKNQLYKNKIKSEF